MTFLLVDDDELMNKAWERALRTKYDAEFRYASTIEEAIEQMRKLPPPDLVLLDLNLPPRTATETVAEIHRLRVFNPSLAVIPISGMEREEIERVVAGVVVEAIAVKQEMLTQDDLCELVKRVLDAKKKTSGELLNDISRIIQKQ